MAGDDDDDGRRRAADAYTHQNYMRKLPRMMKFNFVISGNIIVLDPQFPMRKPNNKKMITTTTIVSNYGFHYHVARDNFLI